MKRKNRVCAYRLQLENDADGGFGAGQFGGVAGDWVAGFVVD